MKTNNFWKNLRLGLLYLILSGLFEYMYCYHNFIWSSDLQFHIERISELAQTKLGAFPYVTTHTFAGIGSLVNLFYPTQLLYPLIILIKLMHNDLLALYLYLGLVNLLTLIVTDYAVYSLTKKRAQSITTALLYTFSFYRMAAIYAHFGIGEFLAMTFLPLLLVGVIKVAHKKGGRSQTIIAFSGLLYTHLLTAVLASLLVGLVLIIQLIFDQHRRQLIWHWLQISAATLVVSFGYWAPVLQHTHLMPSKLQPTNYQLNHVLVSSWSAQLTTLLKNRTFTPHTVGLMLLLGGILASGYFLIHYRKYSSTTTILAIMLLVTLWLQTPAFPWSWFNHTPVTVIQFAFRFGPFYTLLASFLLGQFLTLIKPLPLQKLFMSWTVLLSVVLTFLALVQVVNYRKDWHDLNLTQTTFAHPITVGVQNAKVDYYPKRARPYINELSEATGYINHQKCYFQGQPGLNQMTYQLNTKRTTNTFDLPFLVNGPNYQVFNNGQAIKYHISRRGTFLIHTTTRHNHLKIIYQPTWLDRWANRLALIGSLGLIIAGCWALNYKRKHNQHELLN